MFFRRKIEEKFREKAEELFPLSVRSRFSFIANAIE